MKTLEITSIIMASAAIITVSLAIRSWRINRIKIGLDIENIENNQSDEIKLHNLGKVLSTPKEKSKKQFTKKNNPFQPGTPIMHLDHFYGRKDILDSITCYDDVTRFQMRSFHILGVQGSGKTSFLKSLESEFLKKKSNVIPVYIAAQRPFESPEDFYSHMLQESISALKKQNKSIDKSPLLSEKLTFTKLGNFIAEASNKNCGFLMLLDDFDNLKNWNNDIFVRFLFSLKSLISKGKIGYVIATFNKIEWPSTHLSRFEFIFQPNPPCLGPLSEQDARSLVEQDAQLLVENPASKFKNPFKPEDIDYIVKVAGRMPFMIQIVCYLLYDLHQKGIIDEDARFRMKKEYAKYVQKIIDKQLLQLTAEELSTLINVSKRSNANSFQGTLTDLEKYGFIEQVDGQYKVLGEVFEEYLLNL